MKRFRCVFIVVAAWAGMGVAGWASGAREGNAAGRVPGAEGKKEAVSPEEWIRRLGDDSWSVRERATRALWEQGEAALGVLKRAMLSDDPEVVRRARELADKIDLGLLPDTSEKVAELVRSYMHVEDHLKSTVLRRLLEEKAWRQVLKLYERETDRNVRKVARSYATVAVLRGAREAIADGKLDEALKVLEMAPHDARGLVAWAAFHAARGTARDELKRARDVPGVVGAQRRMALLRALGDLKGAAREAQDAGEPEIAAAMRLMLGDPLPWLERAGNDGRRGSFFRESYIQWAVKRWKTGESDREIIDSVAAACREAREDDLWAGAGVLFSMGQPGLAEKWYEKITPGGAAVFYASQERFDDFLRVMGLDPKHPDYRAWTKKRLERMLDDPDHTDREREDVMLLCSVMEERGHGEDAASWLETYLDALAKKDAEVFLDVLGDLYAFGIETAAVEASVRFVGENNGRWEQVAAEIARATASLRNGVSFAPGSDGEEAPEWIGKQIKDLPVRRRLRVLMALTGFLPGEVKLRAEWIERLHKIAETKKGKERERLLENLLAIIRAGGEYKPALEVAGELVHGNPEHPANGYYLLLLSAGGKWRQAADGWKKRVEMAPYSPTAHAYLAVSLRRMGRENEARREEKIVDLMALADGSTCVNVAQAYASAGDFKRAAKWWRRAVIQAKPKSSDWYNGLEMIRTQTMEQRDWKLAAALSEVFVAEQLSDTYIYYSPPQKLRGRFDAELARAMDRLPRHRKEALELLDECDNLLPTDGSIADYFLPALREAGLIAEHDRYFDRAWKHLSAMIKRFPDYDNVRNTAAWIAARATRRLDDAARDIDHALARNPNQAAYLDTRAEVWFASGNREKALEWSRRAVEAAPGEVSLRRQLERFRTAPLPEKK